MSEDEEWMRAEDALLLLGNLPSPRYAICNRAYAGMIKARAKLYIDATGRRSDDAEVPRDFWWAKGDMTAENWGTGDFETISPNIRGFTSLHAFGVTFLRSDIENMRPEPAVGSGGAPPSPAQTVPPTVFIGHGGRSLEWLKLKEFLSSRLHLSPIEFNSTPAAGVATTDRLMEMLDQADFAFLILTAEDERSDGKFGPRLNVVHEAGLFQGRLSFKRAIILLEEGCDNFSNVHGLNDIRFPKGNIDAAFEKVRGVLEREGLI
jgi:hypothetical protein